jgi:hypothetical protein
MLRHLPLLLICFLFSGCTSLFKVITDDPVRASIISKNKDKTDAISTISLDSSRRNVIVRLTDNKLGQFCAEPPPDTATAIESIFEASAKATAQTLEKAVGVDGTIKDSYKAPVVLLSKRTELLDIYRTGTYSICQLNINGAITPSETFILFQELTKLVLSRVGDSKSDAPDRTTSIQSTPQSGSPASSPRTFPLGAVEPVTPIVKPLDAKK